MFERILLGGVARKFVDCISLANHKFLHAIPVYLNERLYS
jgi:hypothetical protein